MLINKQQKIVANSSQPTLSFTDQTAYSTWLTNNGLTHADAIQKFDIIIQRTGNSPLIYLGGTDCTAEVISVPVDGVTIGRNSSNQLQAIISTTINASSTDTQIPSAKAVYTMIGTVESSLDDLISGGGVI